VTVVSRPVVAGELCWRSVPPPVQRQNLSLADTGVLLTATTPNEAWLAWHESGWTLDRWTRGKWSDPPEPACDGMLKMGPPVALASGGGAVFVALQTSGRAKGSSAIRVARLSGTKCEWLGEPLVSADVDWTHVHEVQLAVAGGQPIVAWSEEVHVQLGGLFAARWDGRSWKRMGNPRPRGANYYLAPHLHVDARSGLWLTWTEGGRPGAGGALRVAKWSEPAWSDVGESSLASLVGAGGGTAALPSLVVDGPGQAWVAWIATTTTPYRRQVVVARLDGDRWSSVAAPPGAPGKDGTGVHGPAWTLRAGRPTLAWAQADASDNTRLFVAEWSNGRWERRLSGLHVAEGVSNVGQLRLAAADASGFFAAWDEPGQDDRRTRLVQAYECAPGEAPAAPPKSVVERETWPTTVEEAARQLVAGLDEKSKARLRADKRADLIQYHHGWGTGIRNGLGLWRGNTKLLESCGGGKPVHPDDCSMTIIEAVWEKLRSVDGGRR
jgi:hypothetical protein